jgi:acyl transferase domain-containing protein
VPRWSAVLPGRRRRVELPTYPFQHRRFWIDPPSAEPGIEPVIQAGDLKPTPNAARDPAGWLRSISWRRLPPLPLVAPPGPLLVFADDSPLSQAVLARAGDAIAVRAADGTIKLDAIAIDPSDERDWRRLVDNLFASGRGPATVLYLWSLAGDDLSCFHHLVALARVLECQGHRHPMSILAVTCGAQDVLGGEVTCPSAALVTGPARVIRCEMPWIASRCVDIYQPIAEAAPLLLAERPRVMAKSSLRIAEPIAGRLPPNRYMCIRRACRCCASAASISSSAASAASA